MARYLYRLRRFLLHKVLHADDTPHAIALGVAIAMLVAFLPLVGFQTAIAIGVAALFHANKAVCIPIVWITNPFTLAPIYGGCWALGRFFMSSPFTANHADVLSKLQKEQETARIFELQFWKNLFSDLAGMGVELWIGCAVVGVTLALISYFLSRQGVGAYRERRRQKLLKRELFRSKHRAGKITRRSEPA
ncbi:MAG: DUF2062 domain-containing protein [Planctomycetota bacterium]